MAQHQYDIVLGADRTAIVAAQTVGSAISTSAIRVTIDDANCPTKNDAFKILDTMREVITAGPWPPVP